MFRKIGLLLLILMGVYILLLAIVFIASPPDRTAMGIMALFAIPFFISGWYWFSRHDGKVVLTDSAIILHRFWREQKMNFKDIVSIREKDNHLPPNIILKSASQSFKVTRRIEGWHNFYNLLASKINILREDGSTNWPWILSIPNSYLWRNGLLMLVVVFVIDYSIIYIIYENSTESSFLLSIATVFISLILSIIIVVSIVKPGQPVKWVFDKDKIEAHFLFAPPKNWALQNIQKISFISEKRAVSLGPRIAFTAHAIIIKPQGVEALRIEDDRAWVFGISPEQMYAKLGSLYVSKGISFQTTT